MSLKRVHTGYENNVTYHDRIVIISDPIAAPGAVVPFRKRSLPFFLLRVFLLKRMKIATKGRTRTSNGTFHIPISLPYHYTTISTRKKNENVST